MRKHQLNGTAERQFTSAFWVNDVGYTEGKKDWVFLYHGHGIFFDHRSTREETKAIEQTDAVHGPSYINNLVHFPFKFEGLSQRANRRQEHDLAVLRDQKLFKKVMKTIAKARPAPPSAPQRTGWKRVLPRRRQRPVEENPDDWQVFVMKDFLYKREPFLRVRHQNRVDIFMTPSGVTLPFRPALDRELAAAVRYLAVPEEQHVHKAGNHMNVANNATNKAINEILFDPGRGMVTRDPRTGFIRLLNQDGYETDSEPPFSIHEN